MLEEIRKCWGLRFQCGHHIGEMVGKTFVNSVDWNQKMSGICYHVKTRVKVLNKCCLFFCIFSQRSNYVRKCLSFSTVSMLHSLSWNRRIFFLLSFNLGTTFYTRMSKPINEKSEEK